MASNGKPQAAGLWSELVLIDRQGRQVWRMIAPRDRRTLRLALVVMVFTAGTINGIPVLLGQLITAMDASRDSGTLAEQWKGITGFYFSIIGGVFLARESLQAVRKYLVQNTCTRIEKDLTVGVVSRLLRADLARLACEPVGALHGRVSRSVEAFAKFFKLAFMDFFPVLFTVACALGYALWRAPLVGLIMLGVVPASLVLVVKQLRVQRGVRLALLRSKESLDGTVVEQLGGLEYIRAADTFRWEVDRITRAAEERRSRELRQHLGTAVFDAVKALNDWFFQLLVLSSAIYLAVTDRIQIGDILVFSYLFYNIIVPLKDIHRILDEAHDCSLRVDDLLAILHEPVDRSFLLTKCSEPTIVRGLSPAPDESGRPREPDVTQDVPVAAMKNLVVEYAAPGGEKRTVLSRVSLTIWPGETIGVAGRSGSGKSTWLKVLLRLTHPTWGSVLLGGVPLDLVSRASISRLIGYVSQTPFLFAGTVAENIAYGCEGASEEDVRKAAELAGIHEEILALPGGYQARLAERGQNLSGGQRQRLALARVFLKNPPVLILDEGTSALDNISERHVQKAIATLRADRTVILVAHRLSTLRDADRILVFDAGRIVAEGQFDDLVQRGGVFAELVRSGDGEPAQQPTPSPMPALEGTNTPPATPEG